MGRWRAHPRGKIANLVLWGSSWPRGSICQRSRRRSWIFVTPTVTKSRGPLRPNAACWGPQTFPQSLIRTLALEGPSRAPDHPPGNGPAIVLMFSPEGLCPVHHGFSHAVGLAGPFGATGWALARILQGTGLPVRNPSHRASIRILLGRWFGPYHRPRDLTKVSAPATELRE